MNKKTSITLISVLLFSVATWFTGCNESVEPSLYPPDRESAPQPVIHALLPPDSTFAGVGTMTIQGENFYPKQPYNDYNQVWFNKVKADIQSMTETEIIIATPNLIADSIQVKIAVWRAELFSEPVLYKLKAAVDTTFGRLDDYPKVYQAYGIASDANNNVYVSCQVYATPNFGQILKITPDGESTVFVQKTSFLRANAMKMGPQNKLYVAMSAGRVKQIRTIDESGTEEAFANIPKIPRDLDFDINGNLWVVGQTSLYRVLNDGTVEEKMTYSIDLKSVRVYEGYLYVAGADESLSEQKILRYQINNDGSLGSEELVLDAAAQDWLSGVMITAITFSANGEMYLGTDGYPDALFLFDPLTNQHEVVYPGLIIPKIHALNWGEGKFLFATQQSTKDNTSNVIKIDLNKFGAPYYGRQ